MDALDQSLMKRLIGSTRMGLVTSPPLALTLSGLGGGGSEARMTKLTAANQKPLIL